MPKEKKILKKSEKFITERISKAGTHSLEICVRLEGQTFRKNIRIDEFDTPAQALKAACRIRDAVITDINNGVYVSGSTKKTAGGSAKDLETESLTVQELYEKTFEFFPVRQKTRKRHDTFYYAGGICKYADTPITKLTAGDIQISVNKYAAGHTKAMVSHYMAVWRLIYKAAFMEDIVVTDKTVKVRIPECLPDVPKKKEISPEDLDTFCETLLEYNAASITGRYESQCIWYAIQVMKYCGLRPAECFALTKSDIHIMSGPGSFISVNKAAHSTITSRLEIGITKTQKSNRKVPVPEGLKPILAECLKWTRHEFIFADYHGNLQQIDYVSNYVHLVAKKAGVQFNMYMLRHQLSTDLFSSGTPANVIRDIMGHESASMSLDYAVSNEDARIQAVNERKFS